MPSVNELLRSALNERELDGLYNLDGECACGSDDLAPGECLSLECLGGVREECTGDNCERGGDCEFHIVEKEGRP